MKEDHSNINSIFLKVFLVILLVASFALVNQQKTGSVDHSVVTIELCASHQINADAIAASLPKIPSLDINWTFGSNDNFMAQERLELSNFYCEINLSQKQKYFQVLFLSFKEKLDKQNFTIYHSLRKETPVSYSA